ncbi:MAG: GntG family PLP-dependent aldolase [Polyangiaceae bacterium]
MRPVDLRSDTVTRPSPAMREAMARAEVGDDVYGEDPSVQALEARVAGLLGKQAALFVPSGTMSNQLALLVHTRPGDEVIVAKGAHMACDESGAGAAIAGVQFASVGENGCFGAADVERACQPERYFHPRTRLVCIENTHNRAGGRVFPAASLAEVIEAARRRGLGLHLDGARLWNAAAASGSSPAALCEGFDTVSVCFSKGLGAPVGSAFCGPRETIEGARRFRKMLGGGMRQAGVLAAAASYALEHQRERLTLDHAHARLLAEALARVDGLEVMPPETNIVVGRAAAGNAASYVEMLGARGVLSGALDAYTLRLVTHLDVSPADVQRAVSALSELVGGV